MLRIYKITVNPFQENSFLLVNENKEALVIDPGFYHAHEQDKFKAMIERDGIKMVDCWLTHAHLDHIFGCNFMFKEYGLQPKAHQAAKMVYESAESVARSYGVVMESLPEANYCWQEDADIEALGEVFHVKHTPGHSPGSVSFHWEKEKKLWAGDVLFLESIGRTDLPGGSFKVLENSIKNKLYKLPNSTKVYCGHGPETSIGYERKNNPFVSVK